MTTDSGAADRAREKPGRTAPHRRAGQGAAAVFGFVWTLGRAVVSAWDKDATERAAALTYYAVLALFPALLLTVSLVGLTGTRDASGVPAAGLAALLPGQSRPLVADTLRQMAKDTSTTTSIAAVSAAGAVWAASSYAAVFRRALHRIHGGDDHRPAWRAAPRVLLTALMLLVLMVCSTLCVVVSGELAHRAGTLLHLSGPLVTAWRGLRWPLLVVVAAVSVLVLFRSGPRGARSLRTTAPGGAVAVGLWLIASAGFATYTARMGTYHRLYGPLAGSVAFLVWLWFTNLALLIGAHYNAERARAKVRRAAAQARREAEAKAAGTRA